jgi:hypothetical protein
MQPLTHLIAIDHLPGENYVIAKPEGYQKWRPAFGGVLGSAPDGKDVLSTRMRRLFAPPAPGRYQPSIWNFRRVFCAANCAPGAFPSDVTMLKNGSQYPGGAIIEVDPHIASARREEAKEFSLSLLYFLQAEIEPGEGGKPGFPGLRRRGDQFGTSDGLAQYPYVRESRRIKAEFTILVQRFRRDLLARRSRELPG